MDGLREKKEEFIPCPLPLSFSPCVPLLIRLIKCDAMPWRNRFLYRQSMTSLGTEMEILTALVSSSSLVLFLPV